LVKCNVSSTQDWNARIYAQVTFSFFISAIRDP